MYASRGTETRTVVVDNDIMACLVEIGIIRQGEDLEPGDSLFDRGLIDSLGITILVAELEKRFGISIPEFDLLPDNFDSLNAISLYVNSRISASGID